MNWTLYSARGHDWEVDRPLIMGILNATPDSFSDGGELADAAALDARIDALLGDGVDIFDIGGESTRPGHQQVSADEEIRRVVPVIEAIRARVPDAWISIDTQKARVARAALEAGADIVNDVSGLGEPAMGRLISDRGCSLIAMRRDDCHGDIIGSCRDQLRAIVVRAQSSGISTGQIILDPGLGFGERPGADPQDNMALIERVSDYAMARPVLIGASRKRFIGTITGIEEPALRDAESARLARVAVDAGAAIVRVHNVAATRAALDQ